LETTRAVLGPLRPLSFGDQEEPLRGGGALSASGGSAPAADVGRG
jgi:hypothetical protein